MACLPGCDAAPDEIGASLKAGLSAGNETGRPREVPQDMESALTQDQRGALDFLRQVDPDVEVLTSPKGDLRFVRFSEATWCHKGGTSVGEWVVHELLEPLSALAGAGKDDWFNLRIEPLGLGEVNQGHVAILERHYKGIPVVPDELRVFLQYSGGASFQPGDNGADSQTLELRQPGAGEPLCAVSVQSSVQRDLALMLNDSKPWLEEGSALAVAAIAAEVVPENHEASLLIYRHLDVPHLSWRVVLFESGTQQALVILDAMNGDVLRVTGPSEFRVWTPALNPREAYTAGSARPLKPFPYVDVYENAIEWVQCGQGPEGVWRGASAFHVRTADYHGNVDIQNPPTYLILDHRLRGDSPDLDQGAPLGPGREGAQFCHSGDNKLCGYCADDAWISCASDPSCSNLVNRYYYFTGTWRNQQTRTDFDTPWMPGNSGIQCLPANEAQIRQHVGPSSRQGRRKEILYHAAIAQNFWKDWLGVPMGETRVRVGQAMSTLDVNRPDENDKNVYHGTTWSARTVDISTGLCSFEQGNSDYLGETWSRSVLFHEFGHVADHALHGDFSRHSFGDIPEVGDSALTEAIAALSKMSIGRFETRKANNVQFYGRPPVSPGADGDATMHRAFPTGYDCGCVGANCVGPYVTRFVWVNPWFDFLLSSGYPLAMRVLRNHIGEQAFNGNLEMIDAYCLNTFDYTACSSGAYMNTYFGRLFQNAVSTWSPDYSLSFEASKSWHDRVSDWHPGALECRGPGTRAEPVVEEDKDLDFAPWLDDVTNVTWYSPVIPLDTHGTEVYFRGWGYGLRHGPFSESPASCLSRDSSAQCDYLSLDYTTDRDKFLLLGRRGVQYFIYVLPGPQATADMNPFMEIRDASDQIVSSNDNCADSAMPPNGTLFPCLRYTPPSSSPYRVVLRRGSNSASGSRAQYKLVIETRTDDFPSVQADASPMPPGTVTGRINYRGDADWFYQTMFSSGDIFLLVQPGSNPVHVFLQHHSGGEPLIDEAVSSLKPFNFPGKPAGTYYLKVSYESGYGWNHQYSVVWTNTSQVGSTQDTASYLGDPGVPTPLPVIGLTGTISNVGGKHLYRKSAQTQELCIVDAHATAGSVRLWVERDARPLNQTTTPLHQRIVPDAPGGTWDALATDEHGGLVAEGRAKTSAHLTFVAPWQGDYFITVQAAEAPASYSLWVGCGLVWGGQHEFP